VETITVLVGSFEMAITEPFFEVKVFEVEEAK
jgi:hypothetical protein